MYLLNAGTAWEEAEAEQRNKLARALFETITVQNGHAVEVCPRQEFLPYLALAEAEVPTTDGPALSSQSTLRRSRGDSNPNLRPLDYFESRRVAMFAASLHVKTASSPRRLIGPPDEELQSLVAEGLTLRQIGERVGMSAEGVRWRLQRASTAVG